MEEKEYPSTWLYRENRCPDMGVGYRWVFARRVTFFDDYGRPFIPNPLVKCCKPSKIVIDEVLERYPSEWVVEARLAKNVTEAVRLIKASKIQFKTVAGFYPFFPTCSSTYERPEIIYLLEDENELGDPVPKQHETNDLGDPMPPESDALFDL